mmetsp:Transcript_25025/g.99503  ORF Transcript_25025/g.99503 Transcript_25025/m.99503 type:complete len:237 (-) Transcript_25025:1502-2212(-)
MEEVPPLEAEAAAACFGDLLPLARRTPRVEGGRVVQRGRPVVAADRTADEAAVAEGSPPSGGSEEAVGVATIRRTVIGRRVVFHVIIIVDEVVAGVAVGRAPRADLEAGVRTARETRGEALAREAALARASEVAASAGAAPCLGVHAAERTVRAVPRDDDKYPGRRPQHRVVRIQGAAIGTPHREVDDDVDASGAVDAAPDEFVGAVRERRRDDATERPPSRLVVLVGVVVAEGSA